MNFRTVLGWLIKSLKWGFLALIAIYGLLLAINAVDEDPSPEMKALIATPQVNVDPANGYLAMVGLNAPLNEDAFKYGARWVETFNAAASSAAVKDALGRFTSGALTFKGSDKQLCDPRKTPCLPKAREHAEAWRKLAADNEVLLSRQRHLMDYPQFEEIYFQRHFESPMPSYLSNVQRLALDLIAVDAAEGRLEPALVALEALIAFDRRTLQGARTLLTGMVATSRLRNDYALLGEIVAARPAALAAQKSRLDRMTEPLEIQQVRTIAGRLYEGESRLLSNGLTSVENKGILFQDWLVNDSMIVSMLTAPFFKLNGTLNMMARSHMTMQSRILEFSPENTAAWRSQIEQDYVKQGLTYDPYSPHFWYNPVGKILVAVGARSGNDDYFLRLFDLTGVTRLARLQVDVVTAGIADADIPARIAANKTLYDPYTGKTMGWDADKKRLYFDGQSKPPEGSTKRTHAGI